MNKEELELAIRKKIALMDSEAESIIELLDEFENLHEDEEDVDNLNDLREALGELQDSITTYQENMNYI